MEWLYAGHVAAAMVKPARGSAANSAKFLVIDRLRISGYS